MTVLGPHGCPKPKYGDFAPRLQSTWVIILSLDPEFSIEDPSMVHVKGIITNRDIPVVPVAPNMTK